MVGVCSYRTRQMYSRICTRNFSACEKRYRPPETSDGLFGAIVHAAYCINWDLIFKMLE